MSDYQFNPDGVGVWAEEAMEFSVTRERIIEYAKATNDPLEAHLNGDLAPPVFAVVPVFNAMAALALSVVPAELLGKILHGEQDFLFHQPLRPGMDVVCRGKAVGYEGKGSGSTCNLYIETREKSSGDLLNEQWITVFVRGVDAGPLVGQRSPAHAFDESLRGEAPVAKVVQHVDDDQTFRYSPASGDPMPIHLDAEFAKAMGLPGIIAHGLCTMAFTSWAVITEVAGGDPTRLQRLAVRFSKPVLPGQDIETQIWRAGSTDGVTTYAYQTTVGDDAVIKDGCAEISD